MGYSSLTWVAGKPHQERGERRTTLVHGILVADDLADRCRDLSDDEAPILLCEVIKHGVDGRVEKVFAQIVPKEFEDVEQGRIDVASVTG